MKKLLLAGAACSLLLVGCTSKDDDELATKAQSLEEDLKKQEAQFKAYETTIHDQQEKIKALEAEIAELKTNPIAMEDYIIVFRGDETASFVLPTLIPYSESEDLVETIHGFLADGYDIGLNSYRFEDDNRLLVLDYDENAKRVQGSAGTFIFLKSMKESYFANFPNLHGIKLLMNGDGSSEVIGESGSNAIFVRETYVYEPDIDF